MVTGSDQASARFIASTACCCIVSVAWAYVSIVVLAERCPAIF